MAETLRARLQTEDAAAIIGEAGVTGSCRTCTEAVDMFVSLYGAQAGNLALAVMSVGGVYIGGGIVTKMLPKMTAGGFMQILYGQRPLWPAPAGYAGSHHPESQGGPGRRGPHGPSARGVSGAQPPAQGKRGRHPLGANNSCRVRPAHQPGAGSSCGTIFVPGACAPRTSRGLDYALTVPVLVVS